MSLAHLFQSNANEQNILWVCASHTIKTQVPLGKYEQNKQANIPLLDLIVLQEGWRTG